MHKKNSRNHFVVITGAKIKGKKKFYRIVNVDSIVDSTLYTLHGVELVSHHFGHFIEDSRMLFHGTAVLEGAVQVVAVTG